MKVLIITTTPFSIDGITHSIMNYYHYMDKTDMQMDFLIPNKMPNRLRCEIEKGNGKIFEIPLRKKNPFKYFCRLIKVISSEKYDIVHAHGNSCTLAIEMLAAKLAGVKIRISHSRNSMCKHQYVHRMLRPIFNLTCTHGFACGIEAGIWLFGKKKFTVITNGNDVEKFAFNGKVREIYREKYGIEGKVVIGHIGRFNYQKNHDFLIDIFNELVKLSQKYVLLLVGDGKLRKDIEEKVKIMGLTEKVIFVGSSLEVDKLIQAMDIMVFPSRYEGLPNVAIECQIACLPSLVSDKVTKEIQITDIVEFMPLEFGASAWAKKIYEMELLNRSEIKEQVIDKITRAGFDVKVNANKLKEIYQKLLENGENLRL